MWCSGGAVTKKSIVACHMAPLLWSSLLIHTRWRLIEQRVWGALLPTGLTGINALLAGGYVWDGLEVVDQLL